MTPKTLLQMAGVTMTPSKPSDAVLVVIDAQNEYVDGKLPLTGVQPAFAEIGRLLTRARKAGTPRHPHPAPITCMIKAIAPSPAEGRLCNAGAAIIISCHSGARRRREPGIHNHDLGLWIPGSRTPISGLPEIG